MQAKKSQMEIAYELYAARCKSMGIKPASVEQYEKTVAPINPRPINMR